MKDVASLSNFKLDELVKSRSIVIPDLIRHSETIEKTG